MKTSSITILSTLAIGLVVSFFVYEPSHQSNPKLKPPDQHSIASTGRTNTLKLPDDSQISADIGKIQKLLEQEIIARKSLEEKLETLNRKVAALDQNIQLSRIDDSEEIDIGEQTEAANSEQNWFNEQALIDSGMNSSLATELKAFFEQQELDRMYLRDQSVRENWDRQKFRDEIQKLSETGDAFLSQLDESAYDAYLYASQQPNRVKVTSVLDSSQAGTAGIQPGDHIIRYDNERIYSGFALRNATSGGDINESIAVEVERDGEIIEIYLSRGPLGIRMNSVSVKP